MEGKEEKRRKIKIKAQKRSKSKAKTLIKKGKIPAIFYGPQVKPCALELDKEEAEKALKAGPSHLIDLEIEGEENPYKVLVYDSQFDPAKDKLIHLDFYAVRMDKPIRAEIPIEVEGEAPAVKNLGGTLLVNRDFIEVECLPKDLIDEITINISSLETFEDMIKVKDLNIPENIEVLTDKEEIIALVQPPRSEEELAELEEKPVEDVEAVEYGTGAPEEGEEAETKEGEAEAQAPSEESQQPEE